MSAFRAAEPHGATAKFANAVAAKHGAAFANSWLSPKCCRFTDTTIFTTNLGTDRIGRECEKLLAECGVTVRFCPDVTRGFYAEIDRVTQAKKRVGQ